MKLQAASGVDVVGSSMRHGVDVRPLAKRGAGGFGRRDDKYAEYVYYDFSGIDDGSWSKRLDDRDWVDLVNATYESVEGDDLSPMHDIIDACCSTNSGEKSVLQVVPSDMLGSRKEGGAKFLNRNTSHEHPFGKLS